MDQKKDISDRPAPFDITPYREHYPFKDRWWTHRGLKYHYLDEGEGDPVLMVHGNPTWSFYFRELVKALSKDHRVIVPDHMGCGLSDRPTDGEYDFSLRSRIDDLDSLMEHLGLKGNVTLIAHDWGGVIGSAVAVRHPERFSRFVFMNTAAFRMPEGKRLPFSLYFVKYTPILPTLMIRGFNAFSIIASHIGVEKKLAPDIRKGLTAPYNSWRNRLATLRFVQDIPLGPKDRSYSTLKELDDGLHKLKGRPMLIFWGEKDFIFDLEIRAVWKERFPEARFVNFPDAGHYVLEDARESIVKLTTEFLHGSE